MIAEIVLGTAASPDPTALGSWMMIAFVVINGLGGLLGLLSFFATRREVDKLDERVKKLEDTSSGIRDEMRKMKDELVYSADRRSSVLHNRINPVVENLAALKASSEAFVTCFNNFTEVMKALVQRERETTQCPHDNGK